MSDELSEEQIRYALKGISVPPQPQVMVDLQMEQYMPDPDIGVIARLIAQDPGLAGSLLKVVNSPHYGLSNKITSIQRAVTLLGSRSVINLINALSIKNALSDETIVTLNRFWDSAQDVAATCMSITKRVGFQAIDEAYALGLFHDCGIPLMLKRFPNYMTVLERGYHLPHAEARVVDAENHAFQTNHAVVGYYISKAWRLPDTVAHAIANHHNGNALFCHGSTQGSSVKNMLAILKMAEHICGAHRLLGGQDFDCEWSYTGEAILDYIGLSEHDFQDMKQTIQELGAHPF